MNELVIGIVVWCGIHLMPSVAPPLRQRLIAAIGPNPYRGIFALLILISTACIVIGWRSAPIAAAYYPRGWGRIAAIPLVFLAFFLFATSPLKTNVKRFIRHPQLTGVVVWAVAHLLSNGESRSLLFFGSFGAWALLEMLLISRREGAWERPPPEAFTADLKPLLAGTLAFVAFFMLHPYIFGISLWPGG